MTPAPWEAFLGAEFPGWLLPEATSSALDAATAVQFLAGLGDRPGEVLLLRAASVIAARARDIEDLALRELPALAHVEPPRDRPARRAWEGRAPGRIDAMATLRHRLEGRSTRFVTRARAARRDRPEDALAAATARRLRDVIGLLADVGALSRGSWGVDLPACAEALHRALTAPPLRDAARDPLSHVHEQAALASRHRAHTLAASLHRALREGLDARDPARVARAVAAGALAPREDHARFELAVLLRLTRALTDRLDRVQPERWTLRRSLVLSGRREVAELLRDDGARVRVHFDQACLAPGPYDAGLRRYLGQQGRLRPDITLTVTPPGAPPRAVVIEVKLSRDPAYLAQGYQEALLYCAEYGADLAGWPKGILVAPAPMAAPPRREDDVIAVGWDRWVPEEVLDGLLDGL